MVTIWLDVLGHWSRLVEQKTMFGTSRQRQVHINARDEFGVQRSEIGALCSGVIKAERAKIGRMP